MAEVNLLRRADHVPRNDARRDGGNRQHPVLDPLETIVEVRHDVNLGMRQEAHLLEDCV